jgi:hypothetical protein
MFPNLTIRDIDMIIDFDSYQDNLNRILDPLENLDDLKRLIEVRADLQRVLNEMERDGWNFVKTVSYFISYFV